MTIGIALSGGGIKSYSQLPVLEAFAKKEVNVDFYAGTSMGSAVAAFAASGVDLDIAIPCALEVEKALLKRRILSRPSLKILPFSKEQIHGGYIDGDVIQNIIEPIFTRFGIEMIQDVKIPLAIPAVDIISGKTVVFVSHPELFTPQKDWIVISDIKISQAIRASCSFPFVISAMPYNEYLLIDGGVHMNLPLELIEAYHADKTVAVTMHHDGDYDGYTNLASFANRVIDLMAESKDQLVVERADVHINIPLNNIWVFDFGKGKDTIEIGEEVMDKYHQSLERLVHNPSLWERFMRKF